MQSPRWTISAAALAGFLVEAPVAVAQRPLADAQPFFDPPTINYLDQRVVSAGGDAFVVAFTGAPPGVGGLSTRLLRVDGSSSQDYLVSSDRSAICSSLSANQHGTLSRRVDRLGARRAG